MGEFNTTAIQNNAVYPVDVNVPLENANDFSEVKEDEEGFGPANELATSGLMSVRLKKSREAKEDV